MPLDTLPPEFAYVNIGDGDVVQDWTFSECVSLSGKLMVLYTVIT